MPLPAARPTMFIVLVAGFLLAGDAMSARQQGTRVTVTEQVLGPARQHMLDDTFITSRDGGRYAYAACGGSVGRTIAFTLSSGQAASAQQCEVVVDGKAFGPYSDVTRPIFSRDGVRFAFAAAPRRDSFLVVVDGQPSQEYEGVGGGPTFSEDGRHIAFVRATKRDGFAIVDGVPSQSWKYIWTEQSFFAPDGSHVAYAARNNAGWAVILDGKRLDETAAEGIHSVHLLSGGTVLYVADRKGKRFVVAGDKSEGPYEDIVGLSVSADRQHYTYVAKLGKKQFAVICDGNKVQELEDLPLSDPLLRGGACFYVVKRGDRAVAFRDGQELLSVDGKKGVYRAFSNDGEHFAFIGSRGPSRIVSRDGRESAVGADIAFLALSPAGRRLVLVGGDKTTLWLATGEGVDSRLKLDQPPGPFDPLYFLWRDEDSFIVFGRRGDVLLKRVYQLSD